jgi:flavin-dependent dehydrogenase
VPQAHHIHLLLARGQHLLEEFFPGLAEELTRAGAPVIRWGKDNRSFIGGRWAPPYRSDITTNVMTRAALEWHIRRRVQQLPGIELVTRSDVDGLLIESSGARTTGVRLTSRVDQSAREVQADLVVDASGRNSKAPEWLKALGYPAPEETHVNSFVGYATRWYETAKTPNFVSAIISGDPDRQSYRGGGIFAVEGNRWMLTMSGLNKDYPPTDDEGFLEFARGMATPFIYEWLKDANPISPIYGYRYAGSRRRHYESLERHPENFVLSGDAVCSFNPVYGQGMSVAAIGAKVLHQELAAHGIADLTGFSAKFQKALFKASDDAWLMATGEDLRYPGTEGQRPGPIARLAQQYMLRVLETLAVDPIVAERFVTVTNLLERPSALLEPGIVWRVARHSLLQRRAISLPRAVPELQAARP